MLTADQVAIVASVFLIAGMVKGATGLRLPTVSLALLTMTVGLKPALALLLAPAFIMNVWQALTGGALLALTRRFAVLLLMLCAGIWLVRSGVPNDLLLVGDDP